MDFGQVAEFVEVLKTKDETRAYQSFKTLEKESADTDNVYPFFDLFAESMSPLVARDIKEALETIQG